MRTVTALIVGLNALAGVATVGAAFLPRLSERWESFELIVIAGLSSALLTISPRRWACILGVLLVLAVSWVARPFDIPPSAYGWPIGAIPLAVALTCYGLAFAVQVRSARH